MSQTLLSELFKGLLLSSFILFKDVRAMLRLISTIRKYIMVLIVIILFRHARTRLPVLKLNRLEKRSIRNLNDGRFNSPGICQMSHFLNSEHLINP